MTLISFGYFDCTKGVGLRGGIGGQAGRQSSGVKFGGASAPHHRERNELRQPAAGAGLPPPCCRYLQVTPLLQNRFLSLDTFCLITLFNSVQWDLYL